ncbi:M15 family metallopeptidase [Marinigracilibium pacificum]|uniref:D-alanyl-D-alanine dipeptidase n=1 Tax=Marinigracilibium pacificum TaxID=2729599 RepID=A0A848J2L9_9BACT|nr:M15 family metallopeptidase [Marinigracilibium pacificum]NMM49971.1 M15 family metallopeptidase [Marinigracilibium pacificum]
MKYSLPVIVILILIGLTGFNLSNSNHKIIESDTSFVFIENLSDDFMYDMRYATEDNFINKKVYDCDKCMIRKEVAMALINANREFMKLGYKIKFYDCYRPLDVQKEMWKIYPKPGYVANPYNGGSIHNRGGAVDLTLVDMEGNEIAMGTDFDYFGKKANHTFQDLPENIISNRKLLKSIMLKHGFKHINTEWWHYNYTNARQYPISNTKTKCD